MAKIKIGKVAKARSPSTKPKKSAATREVEKRSKRLKTGKAAKPRAAKSSDTERRAYGYTFKLKKFDSPGIRALPDTPFTREGLSLTKLLRSTPRLFINNAVDVEHHGKIKKLKTKTGKPMLRGIMWTNDPFMPWRTRRYHETYIIGLDDNQDKPVNKHRKVLVQCQCEAFVFNFEYANATMGASRLIYSNGQPPAYTNPGLMPGLCKHLVALMKIAKEHDL